MVKLLEDSTYIYSVSAIKTAPLHFNPQAENATEEIMDRVIVHINMFSKHILYFVGKYHNVETSKDCHMFDAVIDHNKHNILWWSLAAKVSFM